MSIENSEVEGLAITGLHIRGKMDTFKIRDSQVLKPSLKDIDIDEGSPGTPGMFYLEHMTGSSGPLLHLHRDKHWPKQLKELSERTASNVDKTITVVIDVEVLRPFVVTNFIVGSTGIPRIDITQDEAQKGEYIPIDGAHAFKKVTNPSGAYEIRVFRSANEKDIGVGIGVNCELGYRGFICEN
jgi:hypothetical protein